VSVLLDAVRRIGRSRDGRFAVHIHLSRLPGNTRPEVCARDVVRSLEAMVNGYRGTIFTLSNHDLVLLLLEPDMSIVLSQILSCRRYFRLSEADDQKINLSDRLVKVFDLAYDYDVFLGVVSRLVDATPAEGSGPRPRRLGLTADSLGGVQDRLAALDVSPFVRRQSAITISGRGTADVLFQEFFVSIADLQAVLAPDLQLHSNRWLFQHFCATLDRQLLRAMQQRLALTRIPSNLHLNLSLATLSDPAFWTFAETISATSRFGVELQIIDVMADAPGFYAARDRLRQLGHRLVIDAVDEATLSVMDVSCLEADLVKLTWSPQFSQLHRRGDLGRLIAQLDGDRVVLARCDSEAAIVWGMDRGLSQFQGRYIEQILAATRMGNCGRSAGCTLAQCGQRRSVVTGAIRQQCPNPLVLDTEPSIWSENQQEAAE
jgi:EAL domain-containing protein (putative c-di-GMP-specific phosphodiesterase class I)